MSREQQNRSGKSTSSFLYNPAIRGWFFQICAILAIVFGIYWLRENTLYNLAQQGKDISFDFFRTSSEFAVLTTPGSWLLDYSPGVSNILDLFWVGVVNTVVIAVLGIVLATILGFAIGIMRLSHNFIISAFATIYIEVLRNIPLLLQLFFWYFVVLRSLAGKRERLTLAGDWLGVNITGLYMPFPHIQLSFVIVILLSLLAAFLFARYAARMRQAENAGFLGQLDRRWVGLAIAIIPIVCAYHLLEQPIVLEMPQFRSDGPIFRQGYVGGLGMVAKPEMLAMLFALSVYTSSFIAENVRSGLLAVNKGQWEAANSLGLRRGQTMKLIIIPQAMRVIIPPLASQYLNLTKNSSLAVAIAYPDVVSLFGGTALAQLGREVPMIFAMMMLYLFFSISTAILMNWYNARVQLQER